MKDLCGTLNFLRNNTSKNCKNIVESHSWTPKLIFCQKSKQFICDKKIKKTNKTKGQPTWQKKLSTLHQILYSNIICKMSSSPIFISKTSFCEFILLIIQIRISMVSNREMVFCWGKCSKTLILAEPCKIAGASRRTANLSESPYKKLSKNAEMWFSK